MKYPFSVYYTEEYESPCWVARSSVLKGCIGVGITSEEAIKELSENEVAWLETAEQVGILIPKVPVENEKYSGKLSLRLSPSVHRRAAEASKKEGISLNQFINDAIITYTADILHSV